MFGHIELMTGECGDVDSCVDGFVNCCDLDSISKWSFA